jgi:hypothetical protein
MPHSHPAFSSVTLGVSHKQMVVDHSLMRRLLGVMLVACLLTLSARTPADELERIVAVAQGGATDLALRLLAKQQPSPDQLNEWMRWEKQRLEILAQTRQWSEIGKRVDELPRDLPPSFVQWAREQAAHAQLSAEDGTAARKYLRELIWETPADAKQFAEWRQLIIRSYLLDNNISDAHNALLRYKQDYRADTDAWRHLHASVLLRAGRNKAAFDVLQDTQSLQGKILRALAGLRSGVYQAAAVKAAAMQLVQATQRKPELQQQAWALVAEAAARAGDDVYRVIALEQAITLSAHSTPSEGIFTINADDLWQAYEWLAETLGNRIRLLVGNDQAWFDQARDFEKEEKIYARALYGFIAQRGAAAAARREAHKRLTDSLLAEHREAVVEWLYIRSKRFAKLETIPDTVRYKLADMALRRGELHFAARLLRGLDQPPEGEDPDQWSLRRARIMVYAGDFKGAALVLSNILASKRAIGPKFADRYLQVVFDLQAVKKHAEAYVLLESLYSLVDQPQQQREILFWMADSKAALGEHEAAAELYLRSANHPPGEGKDIWGQSARFRAAEALSNGGLVADARGVYRKLLAETADPRRRAVIERQLQQLWLREQQTTAQ